MSYSLNLSFDSYDEICEFITTFKAYKEKQFKKKEKEFVDTYSNLTDINNEDNKIDRRGQHQVLYHNSAKQYQQEHPELSYRECLSFIYKNNKVVRKTI
jgi:hypothetical protein